MDQLTFVMQFIWQNFLTIWPYLLITIPLAVAVNLSGASKYISRAFQASPLVAIMLATVVGAFSPFCSCSVIPVVASLLISGVPLAPVMAFWIASPSMDPEIFFLSVAMLGWELALWRFMGTLLLSLSAGFLTHILMEQGWLGAEILRTRQVSTLTVRQLWQNGWTWLKGSVRVKQSAIGIISPPILLTAEAVAVAPADGGGPADGGDPRAAAGDCTQAGSCQVQKRPSWQQRLWPETWAATRLVVQFMALAFFLEALILLFVPQEWIVGLLGNQNQWAVPLAALLGMPVYTSNITALPLIGGMLNQGMNPAAALAFLIAGPTTTLPAMTAVWGLVQRRVFILYIAYALVGSVVLGLVYGLVR
ncbi:MAG: permease [Chloroflexota bacterium]